MSSIIFFVFVSFFFLFKFTPPSSLSLLSPHLCPPLLPPHCLTLHPTTFFPQPYSFSPLHDHLPQPSLLFASSRLSPKEVSLSPLPWPIRRLWGRTSQLSGWGALFRYCLLLLLLLLLQWLMHEATLLCMCLTPPLTLTSHCLTCQVLCLDSLSMFTSACFDSLCQCSACSVCSHCFIRLICCRLHTGRAMQRWHLAAIVVQTPWNAD